MFRGGLNAYTVPPMKLLIDSTARPHFFKARPVPYAAKQKVQEAIEENVRLGLWEPTDHSDWATPLVPILKSDGSVRLCGDYKIMVNKVCQLDQCPLPRIGDIFADLQGGRQFHKIDLHSAYTWILVDEVIQKYMSVNTYLGLFKDIFQRIISNVLKGLDGVCLSGLYFNNWTLSWFWSALSKQDYRLMKRSAHSSNH